MLIIGLVLVLGAGGVAAAIILSGDGSATMDVLGATVTTTVAGVFVTGALAMLVFLVGCWLLRYGLRRGKRAKTRRRQLSDHHQQSVAQLEQERTALQEENARLSQELDDQRPTNHP